MFFGLIGDDFKPVLPTLYYTEGVEDVAWSNGISSGAGDRSKETDHFYLFAEDVGRADRAFVTSNAIDLTNIKTLFVDWENTGAIDGLNRSRLIASTNNGGGAATYNALLNKNSAFARGINELDVSSLVGNYYIRVHAYDDSTTALIASKLNVYRIWGER